MSKMRHLVIRDPAEPGMLVRAYAVTHPAGLGFGERSYVGWDQLAYASRGVMSVVTSTGTYVAPPHRAVWIPAGEPHAVQMSGRVTLRTLFFRRGLAKLPRECRAITVSPLLRELVLEAARTGILRRSPARQQRLAQVLIDQLQVLPVVALQLPMPRDARARKAAALIQEEPGASLPSVARRAAASKRTLERLFAVETAMSLGRWRQRVRLIEALRLLAQDHAVTEVALDVGYKSPSAFVSAFRKELGTTPKRYFAGA
ncbi:MAG: helix-turn-helix transcriptional regulator [Myxococcaceae bacterium]